MPQRRDERQRLPVPVQHFLHEPLPLRRPAKETGDRRRNAGFIDEHQPTRVQHCLPPSQCFAGGGNIGPILLSGPQTFFLKGNFKWFKNRAIDDLPTVTFSFANWTLSSASVKSGCSAINFLTSPSCAASTKSL